MGGVGSGGRNRLSEEEKKRRGTFRACRSDAIYDAKAVANVVTGPWIIDKIPEPGFPLGDAGRKKYDELTRALHSQNKLTLVTQVRAELAARLYDKIYTLALEGKHPSASDTIQFQRALDALNIAEHAPPITNPGGKVNKFASCGFSNRTNAPVRLLKSASSGSGK